MFERRSLSWPITLGVIMIVLVVALTVGWVLLTVFEVIERPESGLEPEGHRAVVQQADLHVGAETPALQPFDTPPGVIEQMVEQARTLLRRGRPLLRYRCHLEEGQRKISSSDWFVQSGVFLRK